VSSVTVESAVAVVGLVGNGVGSRGGLVGRALAALDAHGIAVHAVARMRVGLWGPCRRRSMRSERPPFAPSMRSPKARSWPRPRTEEVFI
jgi:hypothetical protein